MKKTNKEKIKHIKPRKETYNQWASIVIDSHPFENWGQIQWGTRWAMLVNLGVLCALHWPDKVKRFLYDLCTKKNANITTDDFDILCQDVFLQKEAMDFGIKKRWEK